MEIEKGINPNCSELVVRLPSWNSTEEFRNLLGELEDMTGWSIGCVSDRIRVEGTDYGVAAPVPIDKVEMGTVVDMESAYVELADIPEDPQKQITELVADKLKYGGSIEKLFDKSFWGGLQENRSLLKKRQPVGLIPDSELRIEEGDVSLVEAVSIRGGDGYELHPALKARGHGYEPHFEPLAKASQALELPWHTHDGGSSGPFTDWCRENGFTGVTANTGGSFSAV